MYYTVNYLFATYLQTKECGSLKIAKVEKVRPGKAKYFFEITPEAAEKFQIQFHTSVCSEFEALRKGTINLAF